MAGLGLCGRKRSGSLTESLSWLLKLFSIVACLAIWLAAQLASATPSDFQGDYSEPQRPTPEPTPTPIPTATPTPTPLPTPTPTPANVPILSVAKVSSTSVTLQWTPTTLWGWYRIKYGTASGVYTSTNDNSVTPATSTTITGLTANTIYYFTITFYASTGNVQYGPSNEVSVNLGIATPTPTPTPTPTATPTPTPVSGVPTLVQHVATGMDRYPVTNFSINLPNPAGPGNALILGVQFKSVGSIASVSDNKGNVWLSGPTVVNTSAAEQMSLYYCLNAVGGTQNITVNFSGLGTTNGTPQAVVSEWYNVATASAVDGIAGNSSSLTPGTITTTASRDLIYQWGIDFSDTNANGGAFNGRSISAGPGFTLLSADLQVGSGDQYYVQPIAGAINPTFSTSGSATWGSVALALKSAVAGTPPGPGIHIVHIQHTLLCAVRSQGRSTPIVMQFPSSGNLIVGSFNSADLLISSVNDNASNSWVTAASTLGGGQNCIAQIVYAANSSTSPSLGSITVTLQPGTTTGDDMFVLYDVAGAATSSFDIATTASGVQSSGGSLTTASLTPSTANGLILNQVSVDFHTVNGVIGSGYLLDSVVNAYDNDDPAYGGTDTSTLDEDNGYAHIYNTTTTPTIFVYTYTSPANGGVQNWGAVSAAFKAMP